MGVKVTALRYMASFHFPLEESMSWQATAFSSLTPEQTQPLPYTGTPLSRAASFHREIKDLLLEATELEKGFCNTLR